MKTKKIVRDIFRKETFLNNEKADYQDLVWICSNLVLKTGELFTVVNNRKKVMVYTDELER